MHRPDYQSVLVISNPKPQIFLPFRLTRHALIMLTRPPFGESTFFAAFRDRQSPEFCAYSRTCSRHFLCKKNRHRPRALRPRGSIPIRHPARHARRIDSGSLPPIILRNWISVLHLWYPWLADDISFVTVMHTTHVTSVRFGRVLFRPALSRPDHYHKLSSLCSFVYAPRTIACQLYRGGFRCFSGHHGD